MNKNKDDTKKLGGWIAWTSSLENIVLAAIQFTAARNDAKLSKYMLESILFYGEAMDEYFIEILEELIDKILSSNRYDKKHREYWISFKLKLHVISVLKFDPHKPSL